MERLSKLSSSYWMVMAVSVGLAESVGDTVGDGVTSGVNVGVMLGGECFSIPLATLSGQLVIGLARIVSHCKSPTDSRPCNVAII